MGSQLAPSGNWIDEGEARPGGEADRAHIASEETARIQGSLSEVAILDAALAWREWPLPKVVATEAPHEAAAFQLSSVPPEALQLPLGLEGAVKESGLGDDQVSRGNPQYEGAVAERQVGAQEEDNVGSNLDALIDEFRVFEIDLAQGAVLLRR